MIRFEHLRGWMKAILDPICINYKRKLDQNTKEAFSSHPFKISKAQLKISN